MAYKTLTTQTMVTLSAAWLDNDHERPLIESLPQVGSLLPSLEKAHNALLKTQSSGSKVSMELVALQNEQEDLDVLHDRKARGIFNVLTGFADLADDPAAAAELLALRDRIYMSGLRVVQWSYTDEAGEAALVEKRLDAADKALIAKLPTPSGTLNDAHTSRIDAAKKLGELEIKKTALSSAGPEGVTAADAARARNRWIRTVTAFVAILGLEDLTEEQERRLLGSLREAERKADRRGGKGERAEPAGDGKATG